MAFSLGGPRLCNCPEGARRLAFLCSRGRRRGERLAEAEIRHCCDGNYVEPNSQSPIIDAIYPQPAAAALVAKHESAPIGLANAVGKVK